MRRRRSKQPSTADIDTNVPEVPLKEILHTSMREYGVYTVENRAIPDIHDGLKPVHRRILWSAYKMKSTASGHTIKTARLSGDVIGKYHPHGSSAVEDAIAKMIEGAFCPLLHGEGNFGSYTAMMPAAAARYTECKVNDTAEKYLLSPYYMKVIPTVPNYDGSEQEPVYLPAQLPLVLATGASGMAVGVTTNIPAFTLPSLRNIVVAMLKGEKNTRKLVKLLEFATPYGGEVISDDDEIHDMFTNAGPTKIVWTCDYSFTGDDQLDIHGISPEWNYDTKWPKFKNHPDIASADDISSKTGIHLQVKLKRNADVDTVFDKLEDWCTDNSTYRCNVVQRRVSNAHDLPEVATQFHSLAPYEILQWWIKWRLGLEKDALKAEMQELRSALLREKLLLLACRSLDVIFALLKRKGIDKIKLLAKQLDISEEDAKWIWSIAVGRLDRLSESAQLEAIRKLRHRAKEIKRDYANPKRPVLKQLQTMQL